MTINVREYTLHPAWYRNRSTMPVDATRAGPPLHGGVTHTAPVALGEITLQPDMQYELWTLHLDEPVPGAEEVPMGYVHWGLWRYAGTRTVQSATEVVFYNPSLEEYINLWMPLAKGVWVCEAGHKMLVHMDEWCQPEAEAALLPWCYSSAAAHPENRRMWFAGKQANGVPEVKNTFAFAPQPAPTDLVSLAQEVSNSARVSAQTKEALRVLLADLLRKS